MFYCMFYFTCDHTLNVLSLLHCLNSHSASLIAYIVLLDIMPNVLCICIDSMDSMAL